MEEFVLETPRLNIRALSPGDAEALFAYRSDGAVARFQSFRPGSAEDARRFILDNTKDFGAEGTWFQAGVYSDGALIGDIGVHFMGPGNAQCEIGYTIDPRRQRRGYGKEAVGRVVGFLFGELGKHRVFASLDPANAASAALLESLGFRREGLFRQSLLVDGRWEDELTYAMLRGEWEERAR